VHDLLRVLGMVFLGVTMTFVLTNLLSRLISGKKGSARWMWDHAIMLGLGLILGGVALAVLGLLLGPGAAGSSLIILGTLCGMAGVWLVL
jgi:hypothetical protein